ncbi:hypothetical protein BHE74_00052321 [Ensete ventricosum]|nr:hypothetical protein BHE74_00052321 [Ensete ventricosum]
MHRVDAVGNSPGVRRELAKGIGNLLGWRKGVREKKTETQWKIVGGSLKACLESNYDKSMELQPGDGPRSSLGIGPGLDDADFAESLLGDSPKGSGSSLGTYRGEDQKTCRKYARGYWIGRS